MFWHLILGFGCIIAVTEGTSEPVFNKANCALPPEVGPCRARQKKFHYNAVTRSCQQFVYGGCSGNLNRFNSDWECMKSCKGYADGDNSGTTTNSNAFDLKSCFLPKEPGVCRAYMPSYYFDHAKGKCERFIYGGCGGNENRFGSKDECKKRCPINDVIRGNSFWEALEMLIQGAKIKPDCLLPKDPGTCDNGGFKNVFYYYDAASGRCENFVYTGCGGNKNRYRTLEECNESCSSKA